MPAYVLDTSALITVFNEEPGAETVLDLLNQDSAIAATAESRNEVLVPFIALMELDYITRQRLGTRQATHLCDLVEAWPIKIIESSSDWRRKAAGVKAKAALSLADAWICALAMQRNAQLVHKDPEYDSVEKLLVLRLPYKS